MSILLISMRAKSTVGTSSSEMVTAPRHGIVSTKGFSVMRAQAFSCRGRKRKHKLMYHLCKCQVLQVNVEHSLLCCSIADTAGLQKLAFVNTKLVDERQQDQQRSP